MNPLSKIFLAGHRGLVGSALHRALRGAGYANVIVRTRNQLDLTCQRAVDDFFAQQAPEYVLLAAATVGGIHANNTRPAEFIRDNLLIQTNVIDAAYRGGVKKFAFLGSSCIYPKFATQPINEDALLSGPLESTNDAYAVAKIAGLKMCQAYRRQYGFDAISIMPTNLYGPNDNFDLEQAHVLPALLRRFHEARLANASSVTIWGTGTAQREFLHVDELAAATLFLMDRYSNERPINVGVGSDISILELAKLIADVTGFRGAIKMDLSKPDGTPKKLLDVSALTSLGWSATVPLEEGIRATYEWFKHQNDVGVAERDAVTYRTADCALAI